MGIFSSARGITPETEKLPDRGYYGDAMGVANDGRRANELTGQSAGQNAYGHGQNANASRGEQGNSLGMLRDAAMGNAPSRAELLSRHQMDQAASAQGSLAASARGPAALAMAQQQAAGNTARSMSDISSNTSAMRADEMARARDAYMQGASGMRGQDMGAQQMEYGRQAQADAAQRAWAGQAAGAEAMQTDKDQANRADYWKFYNAASGNAAADAKSNSDTMGDIGTGIMSAAVLMSDVRAKENIQAVPAQSMEQYLATLSPASYNYNGAVAGAPTGQQIGPASAQAISATQVGQNVVEQRPDGMLAINAPAAIKAGMSADAHINDKATEANHKADAALRTLASLTTAPTVVSAKPKDDWLGSYLAGINATNNVKGPR